jgi:hypothetical protein
MYIFNLNNKQSKMNSSSYASCFGKRTISIPESKNRKYIYDQEFPPLGGKKKLCSLSINTNSDIPVIMTIKETVEKQKQVLDIYIVPIDRSRKSKTKIPPYMFTFSPEHIERFCPHKSRKMTLVRHRY